MKEDLTIEDCHKIVLHLSEMMKTVSRMMLGLSDGRGSMVRFQRLHLEREAEDLVDFVVGDKK